MELARIAGHAQDGSYRMKHSLPSSSQPDQVTLKKIILSEQYNFQEPYIAPPWEPIFFYTHNDYYNKITAFGMEWILFYLKARRGLPVVKSAESWKTGPHLPLNLAQELEELVSQMGFLSVCMLYSLPPSKEVSLVFAIDFWVFTSPCVICFVIMQSASIFSMGPKMAKWTADK